MSRYSGSYRDFPKLHGGGKEAHGPRGIRTMMRAERREEAVWRNANTPHERTKAHRLNRCGVTH